MDALLAEFRALSRRVGRAEQEAAELRTLVARVTGDGEDAGRWIQRLGRLERENAEMRERLETGRIGVERILSRIRFLEDQR